MRAGEKFTMMDSILLRRGMLSKKNLKENNIFSRVNYMKVLYTC